MRCQEDPWPDLLFVAVAVILVCSYPCDLDSSFIFSGCMIDTPGVPTAFDLLASVIRGSAKSVSGHYGELVR